MEENESSSLAASGESNAPTIDNQDKSDQLAESTVLVKKKRNHPGMPDPDAEVIALSPKALLATNRFICEICNKGFQRDQNLQLHRRGHNLPWKLRQRTGKEVRKRVYVCPEPTCIHHDPSRALGDLTGIKKHFCRKHGEKRFKCERCSKNYAVQSDWKAHMKTCGTREYRCDCGTLFSRRDSFVTHRAFCDALAQESARLTPAFGEDLKAQVMAAVATAGSPPLQPPTPSTGGLSPVLSVQSSAEMPDNQTGHLPPLSTSATFSTSIATTAACSSTSGGNVNNVGGFANTFSPSIPIELPQSSHQTISYSGALCTMAGLDQPNIDPVSLSLSSLYGSSSLFPAQSQNVQCHYTSTSQPALSATALLQKAAQMGATSSNNSFLRGLGLAMRSPSDNVSGPVPWTNNNAVKLENNGLPSGGFNEFMIDRPATLDFLGLGTTVAGENSGQGFSAFLNSIDGSFHGPVGLDSWLNPSDRKPSL